MMNKNHKAVFMIAASVNTERGGHLRSIMNVVELSPPDIKQVTRLIRITDPYGQAGKEWKGAWCDGCKEWNPAVIEKLEYTNKKEV